MLKIRQSSSVYRLLGLFFFVGFSCPIRAERILEEPKNRLDSNQTKEVRQYSTERTPASIHSPDKANDKPNERTFHPLTPKVYEVTPNSVPDLNKGTSFPGPATRTPSVLESTLTGQVEKWVGNMMPSRGSRIEAGAKKTPLQTKIYIFKGKIKSNGLPTFELAPTTNKVFTVVNSDKNGTFKVQLPPGEYTVFAEIDGKLYRNSFDGEGYFSTINMLDGKNARENIVDSRDVAF